MSINDVNCRLLTKEMLKQINEAADKFSIDSSKLRLFLECPENLAFISGNDEEITGFIYGYSLTSLDEKPQLFVYSVEVLPKFQNMGIGSKLFQYVVDYSRENSYSECFVITDKGNKPACRVYEKAGGRNDFDDEIVYVIKHV